MTKAAETVEAPRELLRYAVQLIGRGIAEGAYTETVGGDGFAQRIAEGLEHHMTKGESK